METGYKELDKIIKGFRGGNCFVISEKTKSIQELRREEPNSEKILTDDDVYLPEPGD